MIKDIVAETVALELLKIGAIKIRPVNPFTWASGWKSPIYCDNRLALSYPDIRVLIKNALTENVEKNFPNVEAIAGVATAGIPQGVLIADKLNLPFLYVRPKPKEHGLANLIEGEIIKGQKIVVIEDLISTGGSSLKSVEALQAAEINVLGMVAIFTYGFAESTLNFKARNISLYALSNYNTLIDVAIKNNFIKKEEELSLKSWRENPSVWGK